MTVLTTSIQLSTHGNADMVDISDHVRNKVAESGLSDGIVTIFCPSSTSGLTTIEYESGCLNDLKRLFDQLSPPEQHYAHNARWGDNNGYSHLRSALIGTAKSYPLTDGRLGTGTWQQIVLCDFDDRARDREVTVTVVGDE